MMSKLIIAAVVFIYGSLLLINIDSRQKGRYEQTDIPQFTVSAQQHLERGLTKTWGRDYRIDGETRYLNNPGLLTVVLSGYVKAFGNSNKSARLMSATFNLWLVGLLVYIAHKNGVAWWLSLLVLTGIPILVIYGRDLSYHNIVAPLLIVAMWFYVKGPRKGNWGLVWQLGVITFVCASAGWVGWLVYPLLIAWEWQEARDKRLILVLVISAVCAGSLLLAQNYLITGSVWKPLLDTVRQGDYYQNRIINHYRESFGLGPWLLKQADYLIKNFTGPALLASLLGALVSGQRIYQRQKITRVEMLAWATAAVGLSWLVMTGPYSYVHGYLQWLLIAPVYLFSVFFIQTLPRRYVPVSVVLYVLFAWPETVLRVSRYLSQFN